MSNLVVLFIVVLSLCSSLGWSPRLKATLSIAAADRDLDGAMAVWRLLSGARFLPAMRRFHACNVSNFTLREREGFNRSGQSRMLPKGSTAP
jgi:hypothetical protein